MPTPSSRSQSLQAEPGPDGTMQPLIMPDFFNSSHKQHLRLFFSTGKQAHLPLPFASVLHEMCSLKKNIQHVQPTASMRLLCLIIDCQRPAASLQAEPAAGLSVSSELVQSLTAPPQQACYVQASMYGWWMLRFIQRQSPPTRQSSRAVLLLHEVPLRAGNCQSRGLLLSSSDSNCL